MQNGAGTASADFTGAPFDPESGLHCLRYRYYDSRTGSFLTRDPLGLLGGLNPYAYVDNGPTHGTDPFGLLSLIGTAGAGFPGGDLPRPDVFPTPIWTTAELISVGITGTPGGVLLGGGSLPTPGSVGTPLPGDINRPEIKDPTAVPANTKDGEKQNASPSKPKESILKRWYKSNWRDVWESIKYHWERHAKKFGKSIEEYTSDATKFFEDNKNAGKPHQLRDGTTGLKIDGAPGGIYTNHGQIVSFSYD